MTIAPPSSSSAGAEREPRSRLVAQRTDRDPLDDDPLWYRDAVIYELHVRSFYDADGDGAGDFAGLTARLDYLQELGVTALWLLPFCPSPGRDDGYDIADYTAIHPGYGTLRDFRAFLREAHRRGLRVITELVLNHTSDQHAWFQRARRDGPGGRWRDFYVWSDRPDRYRDVRIIFKDFEPSNWTWDPVAKAYFWHRFYSHQPDLNYEHPPVRQAVRRVVDFWLELGVDGLRLDAVPYLYEREGTSCENLPETHAFLRELRRHVDGRFRNRMLLGEANMWPEDAVAYFGQGDECHMAFHFPLMPRLFMAIRREDRFPIVDILQQTPAIPESAQWALFLRNHDELTLEMVTDEDRDYMYRVFAHDPQARINLGIRRRLAPLLGNDRHKIELMNGLLFSMPGTPVIYYGDEIGMGDNYYLGDRNGVRTPMQWSADRNAGFSRANPQKLWLPVVIDPPYQYEMVNVETQQHDRHSLLWWMKRLISYRKRRPVFGRGTVEFLPSDNRKVLAFIRRHRAEAVLVVANLSRFAQYVELDLSAFRGMTPLELFGQTRFAPVGERPYAFTLGPHAFYWFALEAAAAEAPAAAAASTALPSIRLAGGGWAETIRGRGKAALEAILPDYLSTRRWFLGRLRAIQAVEIERALPVPPEAPVAYLALVQVTYRDGEPETYVLPIAHATGAGVREALDSSTAIARLAGGECDEGVLYDGLSDPAFSTALFRMTARGGRITTTGGALGAAPTPPFRELLISADDRLQPAVLRVEQSNTSVVFGDLFVLKLFRRLEAGLNPDLELGRFLTEERNFPNIAPVAGSVEYRPPRGEPTTLAIVHTFLPSEGTAWELTLDALGRYYEDVLVRREPLPTGPAMSGPPAPPIGREVPELARDRIGAYLEEARLLGQRTGELHLALATDGGRPEFAPEPFTDFDRQGLYQAMLGQVSRTVPLLRQRLGALAKDAQDQARVVLDLEGAMRRRFRLMRDRKVSAARIRCHGDYHLGQVLFTGKDFVILDLEGEVNRSLGVRRLKQSPLRDVAGMLRSFHYASQAALSGRATSVRHEDLPALEPWARFWCGWVGAAFLRAYLAALAGTALLPAAPDDLRVLLEAYLLEKALHQLSHELQHRPDWVRVPLQGIRELLESPAGRSAAS
jgi:maltose alpha-D-glucosyltransferase/alpha-amylase